LEDIKELIKEFKKKDENNYKLHVYYNTDVKKLQYKINNDKQDCIDINKAIQDIFFKEYTENNTILINIESDIIRYDSSIQEYKKILITDFIHLKATYWKDKIKFKDDMNYILNFMSNFNNKIKNEQINMNIFSEFSDENIYINDGPLACYCSHVRGIIYGYLNFKNYTIITEDDFHINDTKGILEKLQKVPNDWDIICFGASPINIFYEGDYYKFTDLFHSAHFYIIRNSSISTILENIYPIYDQIDILLSKLHDRLNIYNIPNTVSQKNFESNTQNNLFVVYNSPNYEYIRNSIRTVKILLKEIIYKKFKITSDTHYNKYIDNIILKILFDVILSKISTLDRSDLKQDYADFDVLETYENYFIDNYEMKLGNQITIIIDSCVKGINIESITKHIIDDIYTIINDFSLVNTYDVIYQEIYYPLNYGSTSNVYLLETNNKIVVKVYNENFRWKCINHNDANIIINKEVKILEKLSKHDNFQKIIKYCENKIYMEFVGESLFDHFYLPNNWEEQIANIFNTLTDNNICYQEFNLKNITVYNDKIYFIDFGLAEEFNDLNNPNNSNNLNNFIELLTTLDEKFKTITDIEQQHVYYINLINNIKLAKQHKYGDNIF
jgi:predicted Ser/Thr protein kinase